MSGNYFANNFTLMPNTNRVSDVVDLVKSKYNPGTLVKNLLSDVVSFRQDDRANNIKDIIGKTIASGGSLADANNLIDSMGYSVNDKARANMQEFANTALEEQRKAEEHPIELAFKKAQIAGQEAITQSTLDDNRRKWQELPSIIDNRKAATRVSHANAANIEQTTRQKGIEWEEDRAMQEMLFDISKKVKQDPEYIKYIIEDPNVRSLMRTNAAFAKNINNMIAAYSGDLSKPVSFRPEQETEALNFDPEKLVQVAEGYKNYIHNYKQWKKLNGLDQDYGDGVDRFTKAADLLLPSNLPEEDRNNARLRLHDTLMEGINYLDTMLGDKADSIGDNTKLNLVVRAMQRSGYKYVPFTNDRYKINKTILEGLANSLGNDYLYKLTLGEDLEKHGNAILKAKDTLAAYQTSRKAGVEKTKQRRQEGVMSEEEIKKSQLADQLKLMEAFIPLINANTYMQEKNGQLGLYFR